MDGRPAGQTDAVTRLRESPSNALRQCRFGPVLVDYDDSVLEPRVWTLAQSRWAAELAATAGPGPILELCAGAGQIGLAAAVLADRDLVQVEADSGAAGFARANAARAGRAERVDVRQARLEAALRADERFPVVIADPPYLPSAEVGRWPADPLTAIDGGPDGLEVIRGCLALAATHLVEGGVLLLQVAGPTQARQIDALLEGELGLVRADVRVVDSERALVLLRRPR